jgi:hypothetical protein
MRPAAASSDQQLQASGAVSTPDDGSTATKRVDHLRTTGPHTGQPGCYGVLSAGRSVQTTTINGQTVVLSGSGTYWVAWDEYDCCGFHLYREYLSAADWWNGSSSAAYWQNHSCYTYGAVGWSCGASTTSGFWDGSNWAWTDWSNDVENYSFVGISETDYTYLRMYTQPNGHHWAWSGH